MHIYLGNNGGFFSDTKIVYRGSYMSAHVLLNLLNKLRKRDKMQGAQMLDSIYPNIMTLILL